MAPKRIDRFNEICRHAGTRNITQVVEWMDEMLDGLNDRIHLVETAAGTKPLKSRGSK